MYDIMIDAFMFYIFMPIVFSLSMPQWLHICVDDKENRVREMMKMLGMKMTPYWLTNIVYFFCIYFVQYLIVLIISYCFGLTFVKHVSGILLFKMILFPILSLTLFLWGLCNHILFYIIMSIIFFFFN